MMSLAHKGILGSTLLLTITLLAFLTSKMYGLDARKRSKDNLLLDMIANISGTIDKLDTEFDGLAVKTEVARNRLRQLIALHRENALICGLLGKQRKKRVFRKGRRRA